MYYLLPGTLPFLGGASPQDKLPCGIPYTPSARQAACKHSMPAMQLRALTFCALVRYKGFKARYTRVRTRKVHQPPHPPTLVRGPMTKPDTTSISPAKRACRPLKDSGIEWIGDIPQEWGMWKIKHVFSITSGSTPRSDKQEFWDGDIA